MDKKELLIDVLQKYIERPTEKIQPDQLGLNYSDKELIFACDLLEKARLLKRSEGFGDFDEFEVTLDALDFSIENNSKIKKELRWDIANKFGELLGNILKGYSGISIGIILFKYFHHFA